MGIKIPPLKLRFGRLTNPAADHHLAQARMDNKEIDAFYNALIEYSIPLAQSLQADPASLVAKSVYARDPLTKINPAFQQVGIYDGIKDKQAITQVTFSTLRLMVRRTPPVAAIVRTRIRHCGNWAHVPKDRTDSGFKIVMRDSKGKPTAADKKRMKELEEMILSCGMAAPDPVLGEHKFYDFMQMSLRDSMSCDGAPVEIRPGRNAKKNPVARFQAVDVAQILKVDPVQYRSERRVQGDTDKPVLYVQRVQGVTHAEYTDDEMLYMVRNPSTDITTLGYGIAELEELIEVVSSTIFALKYNQDYFKQNSIPPGIINFVGNYSKDALDEFRRQWETMLKGPSAFWKVPFFGMREGQGVQFTPFRQMGDNDMSFHMWLSYLTNMSAAIFCIHPEEFGFQAWAPMKPSIGNEASPVSRLKHGQDIGLIPILTKFEEMMDEIVRRIDPAFRFVFQNTSEFDEAADLDYRIKRSQNFTSVNEERAEMDMDPLDGDEYNKPNNPIVVQREQAAVQQKQQEEQMALQKEQLRKMPEPSPEQDDDGNGQGNDQAGDETPDYQALQEGRVDMNNTTDRKWMKSLKGGRNAHLVAKSLSGAMNVRSLGIPAEVAGVLNYYGIETVSDLGDVTVGELSQILGGGSAVKVIAKALEAAEEQEDENAKG
jgi:hypothetical protein